MHVGVSSVLLLSAIQEKGLDVLFARASRGYIINEEDYAAIS